MCYTKKRGGYMRYMFISDIHGIKTNLEYVKEQFNKQRCDKLIVLGDLFYIGPRNKMKDEYDIEYVANFLNSFKDRIICIKGNCDSHVDQYVCEFPLINDLSLITTDDKEIYLTHGHIYNKDNWSKDNSVLVYGHKHTPFIIEDSSNVFINPGSISLPKEDFPPTYMIFANNVFTIYDVFGNIVAEKRI